MEEQDEPRQNRITILVGNRGTGKTALIKQVLKAAPFPKKLIVDTFDNPVWRNMKTYLSPQDAGIPIPLISMTDLSGWTDGLYRVFDEDMDALLWETSEQLMDTIVVYEDAGNYIDINLPKSMVRLVSNSKQKNVDAMYAFHTLAEVPPKLIRRADWLILFHTYESWTSTLKNKFPGFKVFNAFNEIAASSNEYERREVYIRK